MPRRSLFAIWVALVVWLVCQARLGSAERSHWGRMVLEALSLVERRYLEPVDAETLFDGAMSGLVGQLDEYSSYLDRRVFEEVQSDLDQQFGGIGIQVHLDAESGRLTVLTPIVGTPALEAGLEAGDRILAIDGQDTAGWKLDDALRLLRGQPGTAVALSVLAPGAAEPRAVQLVRAVIETESIWGDQRAADQSWDFFLPGPERIGYVRITPMFSVRTVDELRAALDWLAEREARGLVLDLRSNPGGLLEAAVGVCRLFVNEGRIVSTRGREGEALEVFDADGTAEFADLPLAVLVDRYSASASEIVAACLQDQGRAGIIGERTWGKGSVQDVILLEGQDRALKLTTASYWRPSGRNIHRTRQAEENDEWGVRPEPGYELRLDDAELARYFEWRRRRDIVRRTGEALPPEPLTAAAPTGALSAENAAGQHAQSDDGTGEASPGGTTTPPATPSADLGPTSSGPNGQPPDRQLARALEWLQARMASDSAVETPHPGEAPADVAP